jgi:hypothetical protein
LFHFKAHSALRLQSLERTLTTLTSTGRARDCSQVSGKKDKQGRMETADGLGLKVQNFTTCDYDLKPG